MHWAGRAFFVLRVVVLRGAPVLVARLLVVGVLVVLVLEDASNKHGKACA